MANATMVGLFQGADEAVRFALAGNARLTLVSAKTAARFTYRVRLAPRPAPNFATPRYVWFVCVLTGSDNEGDFTYLGTISSEMRDPHPPTSRAIFSWGRKSRIAGDAPSVHAFAWAWGHLAKGRLPDALEVWHEGRCGRCGRALTVPSSIAAGLGPECAGRAA